LEEPFLKNASVLSTNLLESLSIGEISILYEYCAAKFDSASRKKNGQYFTPDDIAELLAKEALSFPHGVWLDPCSGIGNLSWHFVNLQVNKEQFLIEQLILSDRDELALEVARVLFTISFQRSNPQLYKEIQSKFIVFDFLSVASKGDTIPFNLLPLHKIPRHDYVLVNPPYLGLKKEDSRFEISQAKDLYAYFLENIAKTSKGFVSVTPQSFTNTKRLSGLRALLLKNFSYLKIYAFDNIPGNIFAGVKFGSANSNQANSTRAAIMVARNDLEGRSITSLLRWRTSERSVMLSRLDDFLASPTFTREFFPKVNNNFIELHLQLAQEPRLASLMSDAPTDYALHIPGAPRYFVSALKTPVSRSSMKTIYFKSKVDLDRAYLLLNSSLTYWWWRVRDGGMTISLETIRTIPVPSFEVNPDLVEELEKSEIKNKVSKKNAGAFHENVKHEVVIIKQLNRMILPNYCERLLSTHLNSDLTPSGTDF
jgi:hypothetical protein